jgi:hypothetical protein
MTTSSPPAAAVLAGLDGLRAGQEQFTARCINSQSCPIRSIKPRRRSPNVCSRMGSRCIKA